MLLAAALLLVAPPAPLACPAPFMAFAPPAGSPLIVERRIERELGQGIFVQRIDYRIRFMPAGRGWRLQMQQVAQSAEGPPELLRLLALQDESNEGEALDATLDADGAVLGISEAPDAPARLAKAVARLRADPAVAARPEKERAQIGAMLDRLAALPPEERAAINRGRIARLVMLAKRPCSEGVITNGEGARYRIAAESGDSLVLEASQQSSAADGSALSISDRITLSKATGLVMGFNRVTVTEAAGTRRMARETLSVRPAETGG